MPKINRYPRGFAVVDLGAQQADPSKVEVEDLPSDDSIQLYYEMLINRQVDPASWRFQNEVIKACTRLFGDFSKWLELQAVYNDNVYGLNFDFILDTLQFLRTGRRDMSIFTWNDLLLEHPPAQSSVANSRRFDQFKISDPMEFANVIPMWLSHANGFEDMLCAAHVLYGVSKKPMGAPKTSLF